VRSFYYQRSVVAIERDTMGSDMIRTIRNTLFAILMLLVLIISGATVYVLFINRPNLEPGSTANAKYSTPSVLTPRQPNPNAPEGVAVESLPVAVRAGDNVSLIIQTNPTSTCKATTTGAGATTQAVALADKIADSYGMATWSWHVDPAAPLGNRTVDVTCLYHGRSGYVQGYFAVKQ